MVDEVMAEHVVYDCDELTEVVERAQTFRTLVKGHVISHRELIGKLRHFVELLERTGMYKTPLYSMGST
ncbi:hypothetical protein J6590_040856 [Homalodisca vitripennis]|nr:hypothetical protein J6590_040856 [Homalodisca vitripennis]